MKKILVLGLVLMLCLAVIGGGYAMWSKTLTVSGTVNTGSIGAIFSSATCTDDEPTGKDVSGAVGTVDQNGVLQIVLTNAYPCITYTCNYVITGTGSVPVHFSPVSVNATGLPASAIVTVVEPTPNQLHTGSDNATGSISVHLLNEGTSESTTYTFSAALEYHQYNE